MTRNQVRPFRHLLAFAFLAAGPLAGAARGQDATRTATLEPDWIVWDAETRTVELTVTAGDGAVNGMLNFNGHAKGDVTVTVPLGARVVVEFVQSDPTMPHSVGVIEPVEPIPPTGTGMSFAFAGAGSAPFVEGTPAGAAQRFEFTADREGRYWLFCGVPAHGIMGMWVWLEVADVERPAVKATSS